MSLQAASLLSSPIRWAQANPKTAGAGACFVVIFAIYAYKESTTSEASSYRKVQASCHEFFKLETFYPNSGYLFVERTEPATNALSTTVLLEKITAIESLLGAIETKTSGEKSDMETLFENIFEKAPLSLRGSPILFLELQVWLRALYDLTVIQEPFFARVFEYEDAFDGQKVDIQNFKFLSSLEKFRYAVAHYKALLAYVQDMSLNQYEEYLSLALRAQINTLRNHIGGYSKKHYSTGVFLREIPELQLTNLQEIIMHLQACDDLDQEKIKDVLNDLQFIQFAYEKRADQRYLVGDVGIVFLHQAFKELKSIQKSFIHFLTQFFELMGLFFTMKALASNVMKYFPKSSA
ncbi:MAG: hypothetical protein K940chlam8_01253 [Chlamydiae bacterium]|nr:hypothetical protein [Chlamydiota bacterium]